jgi:hypothetical protein
MDNFTPNDPLWKLLGHAKPVEPRGNFLQNVVRAARQTPQERHLWARVLGWWSDHETAAWRRTAWLGATATIALTLAYVGWPSAPPSGQATVAASPATSIEFNAKAMEFVAEDLAAPLASLDHMDELLASEDTSSLSDSDIAFLLY